MKQCRMHITQILNFRYRCTRTNQLLFGLRDFNCRYITEIDHEIFSDLFQVFPLRQPVNIALQHVFSGKRIRHCLSLFLSLLLLHRISVFRPCHFKIMCPEHIHNILHRNVLHRRTSGNRHDLSHCRQRKRLCYIFKSKICHNAGQLRILRAKLLYVMI